MMEYQFDLLSKNIKSDQLNNTADYIRYLLISTFLLSLFVSIGFYFNFQKESHEIITWLLFSGFFEIAALLLIQRYISQKKYHAVKLHTVISIASLGLGLVVGAGIYLLHAYLPHYYSDVTFSHALYFSIILIVGYYFFCLLFLTQRLFYFFLATIPAILPIFLLQPIHQNIFDPLSYLIFDIVFIITCISGYVLYRKQLHLSRLLIKNTQLFKHAAQQAQYSNQICQRLQQEMEKSKNAENQLQHYSIDLEKVIQERTQALESTHQTLEKQKYTIELANSISSIHTWEWDISNGLLDIKNLQTYPLHNDEHLSSDLAQFIHPEDVTSTKNKLKQHFQNMTEAFECEHRMLDENGNYIWILCVGRVIKTDSLTGQPSLMLGNFRNIDRHKKSHQQMQQASNIIEHLDVGIFLLDENLHYVDANPCFYDITALTPNQVIHKKLFDLSDDYRPKQRILHLSIIDEILKTHQFQGEFEERLISGKEISIRLRVNPIYDKAKNITNYVAILTDLTEIKQQEKRLNYLENYDTVTSLPNRLYYNYKIYQHLLQHSNSIDKLAIIRLSIDRFTALNEFLGHHATSDLLKLVSQRLRLNNPNAMMIAYLNRDDFVIVYELNDIQPNIQYLCEQIMHAFQLPFEVANQELILTLSIGVAIYPEHAQQFEILNQHAQQALNHARRLGGNTIQYYSTDYDFLQVKDLSLENELRQALRNNELEIYFQPKIQIADNQLYGFETLIRWHHPQKGLLIPAQFLPSARQTSLISDIGQYVIKKTLAQLREWQDMNLPEVQISINIDPQQLYRGQLIEHLDQALEEYHVDGHHLEIEITESSLIENTEYIQKLFNQIKQRNIKLSLDDFGTGYASMAYLTKFPFDTLKIDKHFIQNMHIKNQTAIINAILAMGHAMNLTIVAEGIETQQQLDYLKEKNCDIAQGYLFSRPLHATDATAYLVNYQELKHPS